MADASQLTPRRRRGQQPSCELRRRDALRLGAAAQLIGGVVVEVNGERHHGHTSRQSLNHGRPPWSADESRTARSCPTITRASAVTGADLNVIPEELLRDLYESFDFEVRYQPETIL